MPDASGPIADSQFADMVDDRADDGIFRIDRRMYDEQSVFDAEMERIFEATWIYVAHESQIPKPGDFIWTEVGRQPVIINRLDDGSVAGVINACSHRGALLTATRQGNARILVCRYHGWTFKSDGECIRIKEEEIGFPDGVDKSCYNLTPVPQVESYKGFIFANLNPNGPSLAEHLGDTRPFIDMLADQSPEGMEVLPGSAAYVVDCNWKLQVENGVDGYHVGVVHRNFAQTVRRRNELSGASGTKLTENARFDPGAVETACYDMGHGHNVIWSDRGAPESAPLYEAKDTLLPKVGQEKWNWMVGRGRNLLLYPNLFLMDQSSTQIRIIRPLSPTSTEIRVYCIAPKGESAGARTARLNKFRDFFLTSGLATPDDSVALEDTQAGIAGRLAQWSPFERGMATAATGADAHARELKIEPEGRNTPWDLETIFLGQYRRWRDLMAGSR
jgi:benzoate/toluate 1,2-dioxygenase alpha subunit